MDLNSPDPKLRPRSALEALPDRPCEYPVTAANFPELYAAFEQLLKQAGLQGYTLVLLDDNPATTRNNESNAAGMDSRRHAIGIGINHLNNFTFNELRARLAHEVGHAWRNEHPGIAVALTYPSQLNQAQREEVEADILGVQLTGDLTSAISALQRSGRIINTVSSETHPSDDLRVQLLRSNAHAPSPFQR